MFTVQTELEEQISALKNSEEHAKKASTDASRLAEELRQEQEHSAQVEKARRTAEVLAKDLQTRLDEAEAAAMQGGRKIVQKMEQVDMHGFELLSVNERQFSLMSPSSIFATISQSNLTRKYWQSYFFYGC
jgi:DNA repair ATPase RecN